MCHLEHLRDAVAGIGAQPVGAALYQPLAGEADIMHQHLVGHDRHGQFATKDLIVVEILLMKRLFQPDKAQLFHDAPHFNRFTQIVGADRVVDQAITIANFFAHLAENGNVGLTALVAVKFVGVDAHLFA